MKKIPNPWYGRHVDERMNILKDFILLTGKGLGDRITVDCSSPGNETVTGWPAFTGHGVLYIEQKRNGYISLEYVTHFYVEGDSDEEDS